MLKLHIKYKINKRGKLNNFFISNNIYNNKNNTIYIFKENKLK